jgi:hypothetical protein
LLGHTDEEQELLATGLPERAVGLDILLGRVVTYEEVINAFENYVEKGARPITREVFSNGR